MSINEEIVDTFKDEPIGKIYSTAEIKDMVFQKYGRNKGSVIPSDLCYNSSNYGVENTNYHQKVKRLFLKVETGYYKYVGPNFDSKGINQYEFGTVNR